MICFLIKKIGIPHELLKDENSLFYEYVNETGSSSKKFLMKEALLSHKNKKNQLSKLNSIKDERNEIWKEFLFNQISLDNNDQN